MDDCGFTFVRVRINRIRFVVYCIAIRRSPIDRIRIEVQSMPVCDVPFVQTRSKAHVRNGTGTWLRLASIAVKFLAAIPE